MHVFHVAQIEPDPSTGMGRVALHWIQALRDRGHEVTHVGPSAVGPARHPGLFPRAARARVRRLASDDAVVMAHEPIAGAFMKLGVPLILFSHGLERRGWEVAKSLAASGEGPPIRLRSRLLYPLWRLRLADIGVRRADGLLVINREDAEFARRTYGRQDAHVFRNGVHPTSSASAARGDAPTILFMGAWLARKGTAVLRRAAESLDRRGYRPRWLLAGTRARREAVLEGWPQELQQLVEVVPEYAADDEDALLSRGAILALPSYFEGQPLSLLQAMAAGLPCVASDCCGQKDLIRHDVNGLLHTPGDAEAFAEQLIRLLDDEPLRVRLGEAARESVRDRDWTTVSREVAAFVEEVVRGTRASVGARAGA
jgi:glycosyltransferase involved in cell wall biosynthesis